MSEGMCRRTIETEDLPAGWGGWSCWRKTWEDYDECIWHAQTSHKSYEELNEAWQEENTWPQKFSDLKLIRRLDEADLNNLEVETPEETPSVILASEMDYYKSGSFLSNATFLNGDFNHADLTDERISPSNVDFTGADFRGADLSATVFSDTNFSEANLSSVRVTDAHMHGIVFDKADMKNARIQDSNMYQASLKGSDLAHAEISRTYLAHTEWLNSNLEGAEICESDLRDADLTGARTHELLISDVRLNEGTNFGEVCTYEVEDGEDSLSKAIRVYRLYQRLLRQASLTEDIRYYRIRERHCRRKLARAKQNHLNWLNYTIQWLSSNYGESVQRVLTVSGFFVAIFSLLYPITGLRAGGNLVSYETSELSVALGKGVYFSMMTFTTLGYGDIQPVGLSQVLSTIEAGLGAILIALLVFVLGRQATW